MIDQLHLFEAPPPLRRLRWYQQECIDAVQAGWLAKERRQLCVMATGSGKSVVMGNTATLEKGRVLALVHRDELVGQLHGHLVGATGGEFVDIEQAGNVASPRSRLVVASVQTVTQSKRLQRWARDHFDLVMVDEAHRYVAKTFKRVLDYFTGRHLLVTATPDRGDERSLGLICDNVAYTYDIVDGIDDGYLVPVLGRSTNLESVKLDKVKITAGDFDEEELDAMMYDAAEGVAHEHLTMYPNRKSISFWPRVRSAELYCTILNRYNPDSAFCVSGNTPTDERRELIRQFKRGQFQHFCNVDIAVEGFDCLDVDLIVGARPTKSRARYAQGAGRGVRILDGVVDHLDGEERAEERRAAIAASAKPNCVILDVVRNSERVSLASVEDILGGSFNEAEIAKAKSYERDREYDGLTALRRARAELRNLVNAHARPTVSAERKDFDPFNVMQLHSHESPHAIRYGANPITHLQRSALEREGIHRNHLQGMPRRRANELISEIIRRKREGLADFKQLADLAQHGYNGPRDITWAQAQHGVDYIVECFGRRQRPDAHELARRIIF